MDGSAKTILVGSGLKWVNSLAMDSQNRLLYWCDAHFKKIERIDLQGNNRMLVKDLSLDSYHPFGLALDNDALYWSDWSSKSVHKHNMTSSVTEVLIAGMGRPMELHIYSIYSIGKYLVALHNDHFLTTTNFTYKVLYMKRILY